MTELLRTFFFFLFLQGNSFKFFKLSMPEVVFPLLRMEGAERRVVGCCGGVDALARAAPAHRKMLHGWPSYQVDWTVAYW